MPKTAWPLAADITPYLASVTLPDDFDMDAAIQGAIEEFEAICGRTPFLADASATSKTYDPPTGQSGAFILGTHDFYTVTSVVVDGTAYVDGDDYLALHRIANGPTEGIEFLTSPGDKRRTVVVTGRLGTFVNLPYRAWLAVAKRAAAEGIEAAQVAAGAERRVKQGPVEHEYAASQARGVITAVSDTYRTEFKNVAQSFLKIEING